VVRLVFCEGKKSGGGLGGGEKRIGFCIEGEKVNFLEGVVRITLAEKKRGNPAHSKGPRL